MKICYCGPVSLQLLSDLVKDGQNLPHGYAYPLGAYLVRTYIELGHQVEVVTSSASPPGVWTGKGLRIQNTLRRRHLLFVRDHYRKERQAMIRAIQKASPDVIHAQWTYEFAHAALDSGLPTLVTCRDAPKSIARLTRSPYRYYRAWYAGKVIPRIKHLTGISDYVAGAVCREYTINADVTIVPNGLRKDLFVANDFDSKREGKRLICVTGTGRRKNIKGLLLAFKTVLSEIPDASLCLIGTGLGPNGQVHRWAQRQGLSQGVLFSGPQAHSYILEKLRTRADVFVHSTLEESFCMTVLEAMAQKLPVVALPDSGAIPWLLEEGRAGVLAENQSPEALAKAITYLLQDKKRRTDLGEKGYQRALEKFELTGVAMSYLSLLETCAGNHVA